MELGLLKLQITLQQQMPVLYVAILTSTPHVASAYVYYDGTNPISVCSILLQQIWNLQLTYAVIHSSTSIIVVTQLLISQRLMVI